MNITIKSANNGFILTYPNPNDEGEITEVIEVPSFSISSPEKEELESYQRLCYTILEAIGYYGSKHHEYRLRIEIVNQREEENNEVSSNNNS